ncbi:MAG: beta-ketoacyl synthase N-terminal-like domain-containing protein [Polyangiaceae bacterium]
MQKLIISTHPEPDGTRASELIVSAMARAGLDVADVGYVNAHGTATQPNDSMESLALRRVFGESISNVRVSSSKGQLGHTLGAAGAIEGAIVVESLRRQCLVPTVGTTRIDPACDLSHVLGRGEVSSFSAALSTSFGFGGSGAVLAFSKRETRDRRPLEDVVKRGVFVSDVVTMGCDGVFRGIENAQLVDETPTPPTPKLPFDPLDRLVMERSRRFDRLTGMTALSASLLLESKSADAAATGLVLGNALGDVARTVDFMKRVRKRGLKGAHPAEFPHTLPSSISGNASIYAGLRGPVLNVSEFGETADLALEIAVDCLDGSLADAMITGSAEALDELVLAELGEQRKDVDLPWTEGAAFLLCGREPVRSVTGNACRLCWFGRLGVAIEHGFAAPPNKTRAEVVVSRHEALRAEACLAGLGWDGVPVRTIGGRVGRGWHVSAFVHAVAAARVLSGEADTVLAITSAPQGTRVVYFARE